MIKPFYNQLKKKLLEGKMTAGCWAQLVNSISAEAMARQGFDWVLIDMEHAPNDLSTLITQVQAVSGTSASTVVRAPWNDFVVIKRILDTGVHGVIIPYVNNPEELNNAIKACKYPPEGIRGIAGSHRACGFGQEIKSYVPYANNEILIISQIETKEAIDNLDEMLKVPGVDGFFIGPMDLATSLGYLANPQHKNVQKVIREIEEKVFAAGKILGTVSGNFESASALYDRGYQMVTLMSDAVCVAATGSKLVAQFKEKYSDELNSEHKE